MYNRLLKKNLEEKLFQGKAIILTGPRQAGKTTLVSEILKTFSPEEIRTFNCDNPTDRDFLTQKDLPFLQNLVGNAKIIFIDEGQKVSSIGQTVKLLVDFYKDKKQVFITGSSTFNLLYQTQEALTGRKFVYTLLPLSVQEIFQNDYLLFLKSIEQMLIFGTYPDVVNQSSFEEKKERIQNLASSALYKDIFEFQKVKDPAILSKLLKALALQIGSEVSLPELSQLIGIDKKTVERYIDLLEQNYVIFRLSPYFSNKRKEISKMKKIYFYDLGIRNALIQNFNFLNERNDVGALWENFLMVERLKYRTYNKKDANQYFWRTFGGTEIDLVEEQAGKLDGYEFKWNKKSANMPPLWSKYQNASYKIISQENVKDFIF